MSQGPFRERETALGIINKRHSIVKIGYLGVRRIKEQKRHAEVTQG